MDVRCFLGQDGRSICELGYHGRRPGIVSFFFSLYFVVYSYLFITKQDTNKSQYNRTALAAMSTLTHHGIIYVPLGYKNTFAEMTNLSEIHGGSPWGAGTFAGADGSRQPSTLELTVAEKQGAAFAETVAKMSG